MNPIEEIATYGGAGHTGASPVVFAELTRSDSTGRGVAPDGVIYPPGSRSGKLSASHWTRVTVQKRAFVLTLGPKEQRAQDLNVRARALLGERRTVAYVKAWLAAQLGAINPAFLVLVTVGQYVLAHALLFPASKPYRGYRRALLYMIQVVLRHRKDLGRKTRGPGKGLKSYPRSLAFPLADLCDAFVAEFLAAYLHGFTDRDKHDKRYKRACSSAYSIVTNARVALSKATWDVLGTAGYPVIDLSNFRHATTFTPVDRQVVPISLGRIQKAHAAVENLRTVNMASYFAGLLPLHAGFLCDAVVAAHTDWLDFAKGGIWCWKDTVGRLRFVPLEPWVLTELGAAPRGFFLGTGSDYQRTALQKSVSKRLKPLLVGAGDQPVWAAMPELVEQFTWFAVARHNEFRARKIVGVTYASIRRFSNYDALSVDKQAPWINPPSTLTAPPLAPIIAFPTTP